MKHQLNILRHLALVIAITILSTSCSLAKLSKLSRQIEILQVGNIEIKGSSGVAIDIEVRNQSDMTVSMSGATITLKLDGKSVATLNQVGEIVSTKGRLEIISTLWRVENPDPMMMLLLASRISQKSMDNTSIDYSAELSAEGLNHTLSGKDIDISKLLNGFKF